VLATGYEDVAILRIGSVAGRRQRADGGAVLARFAEQAKSKESLTIFDKGRSTRCFIHVLDVVSACMALIDNWEPGIYDITAPENSVTIKELAQIISKKMNVSTKEVRPFDVGMESYYEVPELIPAAKGPEGWKPKHTLQEVIDAALTY
jgi:UDP-glucose 4-epimerase